MTTKDKYAMQQRNAVLTSEIEKLFDLRNKTGLTTAQEKQLDQKREEQQFIEIQLLNYRDQESAEKNVKSTSYVNVRNQVDFREYITQVMNGSPLNPVAPFTIELEQRFDPLLSTSNPSLKPNIVGPWNTLYAPNEQELKALGVNFLIDQVGTVTLPWGDAAVAGFVNENADASSSSLVPRNITLAGTRVSCSQSVSREFLESTNPQNLQLIQQNLYAAIMTAASSKFWDDLEADLITAGQVTGMAGVSLGVKDLLNMEASLGAVPLQTKSYAMRPEIKAYLKGLTGPSLTETVWTNDTVNQYNAVGSSACNPNNIIYGDFTKGIVCSWGSGIQLIIDPYTSASKGLIIMTVSAVMDTGCLNPRSFVLLKDVSAN